jgi:hypothetical protein
MIHSNHSPCARLGLLVPCDEPGRQATPWVRHRDRFERPAVFRRGGHAARLPCDR